MEVKSTRLRIGNICSFGAGKWSLEICIQVFFRVNSCNSATIRVCRTWTGDTTVYAKSLRLKMLYTNPAKSLSNATKSLEPSRFDLLTCWTQSQPIATALTPAPGP